MTKVKLEKGRSHQKYIGKTGETYPGVTTILGVMAKPALIAWAYEQGKAGLDFRKTSGQAADIGTIAHFLCECYVKGVEADLSDFSESDIAVAKIAFEKFKTYWNMNGFKIIESEKQFANDLYRYSGTLDIVALDKENKICLIDLKTSKGIYEEYICQLEAYTCAWNLSQSAQIDRKIIVRIGKEKEADFEVREYKELPKHWELFKACIGVYYAKKALA